MSRERATVTTERCCALGGSVVAELRRRLSCSKHLPCRSVQNLVSSISVYVEHAVACRVDLMIVAVLTSGTHASPRRFDSATGGNLRLLGAIATHQVPSVRRAVQHI